MLAVWCLKTPLAMFTQVFAVARTVGYVAIGAR
jgi:citrate synthase